MYLLAPIFLLFSVAMTASVSGRSSDQQASKVPDVNEAARIARTLVQRESIGNLATLDANGYPVSFSEYYIDGFNSGEPVIILLNISSTYRNIKNSSDGKLSFAIRTGDHQPNDHVDLHYPGGIAYSTAGSPRISLKGKVEMFKIGDPYEEVVLNAKFVKRHPDAKFWLPNSKVSAHAGTWAKIVVESVYFIGGFGDRAYIGDIPVDIYHEAEPLSNKEWAQLAFENKNSQLTKGYRI